jgi:hypothetical protein
MAKTIILPKGGTLLQQPKADLILKSYGLDKLRRSIIGNIDMEAVDASDAISKFGTQVFDNIILAAPSYDEYVTIEKNGVATTQTQQVVLGGNTFVGTDNTNPSAEISDTVNNSGNNAFKIDTVLVEVMQTKNIVSTPIAGGNGSVKEYIGLGDYTIKMRGYIQSDSPYQYPTSDVGILSSYLSAPVPIRIYSNFLRLFNISSLVVTEYNMPQTEGRRNLQFFDITAVSDNEIEKLFIEG